MKGLILAVLIMFVVTPAFAGGNDIINHNKISAEWEVNKKFKFLFIDRVSVTAGKDILVNSFGDDFDGVDSDKGWYGTFAFKTDLD